MRIVTDITLDEAWKVGRACAPAFRGREAGAEPRPTEVFPAHRRTMT
jgi:hypothetical protein